jgi:hypothetical protein
MTWIKCSDSLPDREGDILVKFYEENFTYTIAPSFAKKSDPQKTPAWPLGRVELFFHIDHNEWKYKDLSYWIPINPDEWMYVP